MGAKDTVIRVRSRNISWDDAQIQELLRGQDEISSKSGMRVVMEWLKKHGIYYHDTLYHEIEKQLKEWGINGS